MNRSTFAFLAIVAPLAWLFGPALLRDETFIFRDAAHYYYPLFKYVNEQWAQGHLPLWNPLEETGRPLLADPTASVIYPGKLLLALPFEFATNYKLYIVAHLVLAAAATYFVGRRWGATPDGAALGAVSYALSGHVLFQYCNVVFLVGAAWLPLAFWAIDRMLVLRDWRWAILLGVVLSLMVLGGDPQLAYHTGLLGLLYAGVLWRARGLDATDQPNARVPKSFRKNRLVLLIVSALVGFTLSAAQILPSIEWSRRSDRAVFDSPRSLVELLSTVGRRDMTPDQRYAGFWRRPEPDSHHSKVFEFSVGPWRLIELIWPNISGRQFPVHRRWLNGIPSEGRVWTPTLYAGLVPLVAALAGLRLRRGSGRTRWLSWITVLAVGASFGGYGMGWLVDEMRFMMLRDEFKPAALAPGFGGLYWLMTIVLPGYVYFRYPAKLWTLASLGISLAAATQWRGLWHRPCSMRIIRFLLGLTTVSACLAAFLLALPGIVPLVQQRVPADSIFGPIDARLAVREAAGALIHTALTALVFVWLLRQSDTGLSRSVGRSPRSTLRWLALALTTVELVIAQSWLLPTAPQSQWEGGSLFAQAIERDQLQNSTSRNAKRVFRYSSSGWKPREWSRMASWNRQQANQRWDHDTLLPKYHLLHELSAIETAAPFSSAGYRAVLEVSRGYGVLRADGLREPHRSVLDSLGAAYIIGAQALQGNESPASEEMRRLAVEPMGAATCYHNVTHYPRAWVVHDWEQWAELSPTRSHGQLVERTRDVYFPGGQPRDLRRTAIVERATRVDEAPSRIETETAESCLIARDQAECVEIHARLDRPGLVVLSDAYSRGWKCYVKASEEPDEREVEVIRVNRIMRGVSLPKGNFRLVYRFEPGSVQIGLALTLATCICLMAFSLRSALPHLDRRSRPSWRRKYLDSP